MSVGAKNSQCVLRAHLVLDIFYENPASPLYMHIFILFSLIVTLIWRKNGSKKGHFSCKDLNPGLLHSHSSSHQDYQGHWQSSILDSAITSSCLIHACSLSNLAKIKQKKTRFERDLFFICSLWHNTILFFNKFWQKVATLLFLANVLVSLKF